MSALELRIEDSLPTNTSLRRADIALLRFTQRLSTENLFAKQKSRATVIK